MKTPRRLSLALSLSLLSTAALLGCGQDGDPPALVASARSYIAQNDYKAATIQLKNALQKSPDLADARVLLGLSLLEQGDVVGAEVQASKALDIGSAQDEAVPLMARLLLLQGKAAQALERFGSTNLSTPAARAALQTVLAQAYLVQGERERGEAALKAALEADAQHVPARLLQARVRAATSDLPGAQALVGEIVKQHPKDVEAWLLNAALAQAAGDDAAAEQALRQALAARKDAMAPYVGLIRLLNTKQKYDQADKELAALKGLFPGHPQTRVLEAQSALRRKDLKAAREAIQAVLKVAPDFGYAQQFAGAIEYEAGALAQAVTHLTRAQQLMPGALPPRQLLAQALLRSGDPAKALATLQPVLDDKAVTPALLNLAAQAWQQQGDLAKAEALFKRAAALDPADKRTRVALALNQLARGDQSGLESLQATAAADDKDTAADLALINERMRRREFDAALQAIAALEKKIPGQALAPLLRARVQIAQKQPDKARQSLEQAVRAEPANLQAAVALAEFDVRDKQFDAARKRFDALLKADPKNVGALLAVARVRQAAGAPAAEVQSLLEEGLRANPSEPQPRLALVEHHLAQKNTSAALVVAQEAVAAIPDNPTVLAELARVQALSGDFNQSVTSLAQVAAQRPNSVQAQLMLADVQMAGKNFDGAVTALERARTLAPRDVSVVQRLAAAQMAAGRPAQALAAARALQKEKDGIVPGLLLEGDVEAVQRHGREALAAYRAALAKAPASTTVAVKVHGALLAQEPAAAPAFATKWMSEHAQDAGFLFHLSEVAGAKGDHAQSEARLQEALKLRPDDPVMLNNLAYTQVMLKRPGAVATAEKANKLRPDHPYFMDTLAVALGADKQFDRAIELQKKVVALDPKDPRWKLTLARLYLDAGQRAQARTELSALAALGKDFKQQDEVQKLLKDL